MRYGWSVLVLAVGIALVGCGKTQEHIKGIAPAAEVSATVHELAQAPAAKPVVVRGEMIEKCPVAGCWFMLRDKTGVIRVDTKAAGFVVSDVPLHTHMTVAGKVTPGTQPGIAATGLRY